MGERGSSYGSSNLSVGQRFAHVRSSQPRHECRGNNLFGLGYGTPRRRDPRVCGSGRDALGRLYEPPHAGGVAPRGALPEDIRARHRGYPGRASVPRRGAAPPQHDHQKREESAPFTARYCGSVSAASRSAVRRSA